MTPYQQIDQLSAQNETLLREMAALKTDHSAKLKTARTDLAQLLIMIRDAPNDATRNACINSTIDKLSA